MNSTTTTGAPPALEAYFTNGEVAGATYGLLVAFLVLAGIAVPLMMKYLRTQNVAATSEEGVDFWFTARNSQSWPVIALSITATSSGAWLLYTPAEAAYLGGWWAILGYCMAISLGPIFIIIFGPRFREQCADGANLTDWVFDRYGTIVHVWVSLYLIYYMFIYMTGQLKTMGDMISMFSCPGGVPETEGCLAPAHGVVGVAAFTMLYTMFGGLPASLMTDQFQAVAILIIVLILSFFVFARVEIASADWSDAAVWTPRGFEMGWSLCFAVFGAEVFNLAFWQRVFIAKTDRDLRLGFGVGAAMVAILTFLFGVVGLLLKAQDMGKDQPEIAVPAFTFFQILKMQDMTGGMRMLVFILATCMITSSVDSFQIGITSVITRFLKKQFSDRHMVTLAIGIVGLIVINIPAVAFAQYAVNDNDSLSGLAVKLTDLFSMADIITITLPIPIFSGILKPQFTTTKGAIAGMVSGLLVIVGWGIAEFGNFIAGLEMITMMCFGPTQPARSADGAPGCGFYAHRAAILFPLTLLVTGVVTYTISWMERVYNSLANTTTDVTSKEEVF